MTPTLASLVVLFIIAEQVKSYRVVPGRGRLSVILGSSVTSDSDGRSWQEDLDQFLDVDTACDSRRELVESIASKVTDISSDVQSAIQDQDVSKIAPVNLNYGKAFSNFQKFQKQLVSDILPDILTRGIPKVVDEAPELMNALVAAGPESLLKQGQDIIAFGQELSQDASLLQSTVDDVKTELKNIVKTIPEGIDQPAYDVIREASPYEIRKYEAYCVCSTTVDSEVDMMEPLASGKSFNVLASYIFGENTAEEKMSMTTPVIMQDRTMSFVLPSIMTADDAPIPKSEKISLRNISPEVIAVLDFPGIATEGEVNRQRAALEDALISDGLVYDSSSFKVYQYNPPYTLPWLRKNEVSFAVTLPAVEVTNSKVEVSEESVVTEEIVETDTETVVEKEVAESSSNDEASDEFFSSPEAGD